MNKDATLNKKDAVKNIPGVTIESDIEDFPVIPFEQDAQQKQYTSCLKQPFLFYSGVSAVGFCMPETKEN